MNNFLTRKNISIFFPPPGIITGINHDRLEIQTEDLARSRLVAQIFLTEVDRNRKKTILFRGSLNSFWHTSKFHYLAAITWRAYHPTWRCNEVTWHNVACASEFHPLPPLPPLGVMWSECSQGVVHGNSAMVIGPCPTPARIAMHPPSPLIYRRIYIVKLLLTFVSFIISSYILQPFPVDDTTACDVSRRL